jgi:two-component sensor histidine kinase
VIHTAIAAQRAIDIPSLLHEAAVASFVRPDARTDPVVAAARAGAYRWVVAIICLYATAALAVIPVAALPGPELPSFTPFFTVGVLTTELTTSFLLFVWARGARTWSLLVLGCTYLFGSAMSVAHLLTFPEGVLPGRIILGGPQTIGWIYNFWYAGYALLALAAIVLEITKRRIAPAHMDRAIGLAVASVLSTVLICVAVADVAADALPPLMQGASWTSLNQVLMAVEVAVLAVGIGLVLLVLRRRNVVFLLLSAVLTAMAVAQILALAGPARYTIGWSTGRLSWFISAGILFLFFMLQFARQQKQLACAQGVLEACVVGRTSELMKSIGQRDALLREVYHRVKNNMQVVDALLAAQVKHVDDPDGRQALLDVRAGVYALALAHQQLMQAEDLETFDVAPFLRELTRNVLACAEDRSLCLQVSVLPLPVKLDFAVPLGLLTTELLADCLEHARPAGSGHVTMILGRNAADVVVLTVADDRSAPDEPNPKALIKAAWRTKLVEGLAAQLDGTVTVCHDDGCRVEIVFAMKALPQ